MPFDPGPSTLINGVTYNETILSYWNYTAYSNHTLSNGSNCYLVFANYKPILVSANGTFVNATSCYNPVNPVAARGITGLAFGSLFALSILFSTINLRKHGRAYLPLEKRWRPVGRRWPWYWTIFVAASGLLSCFTAVDVDRDYIVNTPMVLQCFFLTLMIPALLACVWECVRSWSSFRRRLLQDADTFAFAPNDQATKVDFYSPLVFYAVDGFAFFMLIPRPWSFVQKQRSQAQTLEAAKPVALDARFKLASVLSAVCLALIVSRLAYSARVYRSKIPQILVLIIALLAVRAAYALAGSWNWALSPYRLDVGVVWLYGLGYAPAILILVLVNVRGYLDENEDRALISQRAVRGDEDEDGIRMASQSRTSHFQPQSQRPPSWWFKSRDHGPSHGRVFKEPDPRTRKNVAHNPATSRPSLRDEEDESGSSWWRRQRQGEEDTRSRNPRQIGSRPSTGSFAKEHDLLVQLRPGERNSRRESDHGSVDDRSGESRSRESEPSSSTSSLYSRPQVVRSMLDV